MSWRNTLGYTIRGAVAAARGAAEGQVAVLQAKTARERQEAELSYNQRLADLKEMELRNKATFDREALAEEGRQFDKTDATTRDLKLLDVGGTLYAVNMKTKTAEEITRIETSSRENVAEIGAGADKAVAETSAGATRAKAEMDAETAKEANASKERIAEMGAESAYDVVVLRAKAQKYTDDIKLEIAEKGNASAEAIAGWQVAVDQAKAAAEASGGVKSTTDLGLGPEQIDRVDKLTAQYRQEKGYEDLQTMRSEFTRAYATYERIRQQDDGSNPDIETGVMDIALINIFQRMIDPGVSVREGDVELLQSAMGVQAKLGLWLNKVTGEGVKLTKEARAEMFQLITDFYTQAMVRKSKDLSFRYRTKIDIDGLLKGSGVDVRDLGTDFYEEYGKALEGGETSPPDDGAAGDPDAPVPGLTPDTGEADDTGLGAIGSARRTQMVNEFASRAVALGLDTAQLQKYLLEYLDARGLGQQEDFIVRVLQRFAELSPDEAPPDTVPDTPDEEAPDNEL